MISPASFVGASDSEQGVTVPDNFTMGVNKPDYWLIGASESAPPVDLRWYMRLNGTSFARFDTSLSIGGDFSHEFTGTFSANGFHLLSNDAGDSSLRVIIFANDKKMYSGLNTPVAQLTDAGFNTMTDGLAHKVKYGRTGGVWFFDLDDSSISSPLESDTITQGFTNFGNAFGRGNTSIPLFEGYHWDHTITYSGTTLTLPFDEAFDASHIFYDDQDAQAGVKYNDVADDYTQTEPS